MTREQILRDLSRVGEDLAEIVKYATVIEYLKAAPVPNGYAGALGQAQGNAIIVKGRADITIWRIERLLQQFQEVDDAVA